MEEIHIICLDLDILFLQLIIMLVLKGEGLVVLKEEHLRLIVFQDLEVIPIIKIMGLQDIQCLAGIETQLRKEVGQAR